MMAPVPGFWLPTWTYVLLAGSAFADVAGRGTKARVAIGLCRF
jgi:hypothetical protein